MTDPILGLVAQLPRASVDPDRVRRTSARCHRILARRAPLSGRARPRRWPSWSPALIGLAGLYFADVVRRLTQVFGSR